MKSLSKILTMTSALLFVSGASFAATCVSNQAGGEEVLKLNFNNGYLISVQEMTSFPYSKAPVLGAQIPVAPTQAADQNGFKSVSIGSSYTTTYTLKFNLDKKLFVLEAYDSDDGVAELEPLNCDVTDSDIFNDPRS